MLTPVCALAIASLLLVSTLDRAERVSQRTGHRRSWQFLGFRAGARLDELADHLRNLAAASLRCRQSRIDRRVSECRAALDQERVQGAPRYGSRPWTAWRG